MNIDNNRPQDAPETILAADGKTVLNRFRVDAVIFAPSRAAALSRISVSYLDAARLYDEDAPTTPDRAALGQLTSDELRVLVKSAVELWENTGDETGDYLSSRQQEVLSKARQLYYEELGENA